MILFILILVIACIWLIFFDPDKKEFIFNKNRIRSLILFIISALILFIGVRGGGPILTSLGGFLAIIAALFSRLIILLPNILLALRIFPFFTQKRAKAEYSGKMTKQEAQQILEVGPDATKEEIMQAYKKAISRNHPDQGGSNYLAAQINEAKNILIKGL